MLSGGAFTGTKVHSTHKALVTGQLGINVQARSFHTRPGIRVIMCLVSVMLFKKIGLKKSF
jgi:hypothetical protein